MTLRLEFEQSLCPGSREVAWQNKVWLHLIVLLLAIASLTFSIKYINDIANTYKRLRGKYRKRNANSIVHFRDKMQVINQKNEEYKATISRLKTRVNQSGTDSGKFFHQSKMLRTSGTYSELNGGSPE